MCLGAKMCLGAMLLAAGWSTLLLGEDLWHEPRLKAQRLNPAPIHAACIRLALSPGQSLHTGLPLGLGW